MNICIYQYIRNIYIKYIYIYTYHIYIYFGSRGVG